MNYIPHPRAVKKRKLNIYLLILAPPIVIALFISLNAKLYVLPSIKEKITEANKEILSDICISYRDLLSNYDEMYLNGKISKEEAYELAIKTIGDIKFGNKKQNYFWVLNKDGKIISHPFYTGDKVLSKEIKKPIQKITQLSADSNVTFLTYQFPYINDTTAMCQKTSCFITFDNWGWIVGTGFYDKDVLHEFEIKIKGILTYIGISGLILFSLLLTITYFSFRGAKKYQKIETDNYFNQSLLQTITDHTGDGLIIFDEEKLLLTNKNLLNILDIKNNRQITPKLITYVDEKYRNAIKEVIRVVFRSDNFYTEKIFWMKDFKDKPKCARVRFISQKNQLGKRICCFIISDITVKEQYEKQVEELSSIVKQSPSSIIITDLEGNIEYVNHAFEKQTGYTFAETIGENTRILKSDRMPKKVYKDLWDTITSGNTWSKEILNKDKHGNLFWELTIIFPILNKKGAKQKYVSIKTDITELKKTKNELIVAKEKAEESDKLKTAFIANVSHEINTPLNAISGFTQVLISESTISLSHKEYLRIIYQNSKVLHKIYKDMMYYSQVESGIISNNPDKFRINDFIYKICSKHNLHIQMNNKKDLTLQFLPDRNYSDIYLTVNRKTLSVVLDKLIENAIKYTNDGLIKVSYQIDEEYIKFSVADNGIGIPERYKEKIFQLFYHGEKEYVSQHKGLGMGLSIAKEYVAKMEGTIHFESNEEKGTTFYFLLPKKYISFAIC